MARNYEIDQNLLKLRSELIWSLDEYGINGQEIADLFNMEKSWINRIKKQKPVGFKSILLPAVK